MYEPTLEDLTIYEDRDRLRHRRRVRMNRKYKTRDRFKARGAAYKYLPCGHWRHRPEEKDVQFSRRKCAPELGYGVAYEHRGDVC